MCSTAIDAIVPDTYIVFAVSRCGVAGVASQAEDSLRLTLFRRFIGNKSSSGSWVNFGTNEEHENYQASILIPSNIV
jgi:hypothetical protein